MSLWSRSCRSRFAIESLEQFRTLIPVTEIPQVSANLDALFRIRESVVAGRSGTGHDALSDTIGDSLLESLAVERKEQNAEAGR